MATNFMNLDLPTPTVTLGPEWATDLNTALELVDEHDHSSGKGAPVPTSGLNINADVPFNEYRASNLFSAKFMEQDATLTGASNANSVYSVSGDLYYTSGAGVAVQLTSGGSIVAVPANTESFQFDEVSTDLVISPSDNFVVLDVDTSAARSITLPAASAVAVGRVYIICDQDGDSEANNITILPDGSDTILGEASYIVDSNYAAVMLIGNGLDGWRLA